jgi:hypothetical protein
VINEAHDKNWIAVGGTGSYGYGLAKSHAYTIMAALTLTDETGKEWNLLKMRNPWASEGYNGPWNDKDHVRWTDEKRA